MESNWRLNVALMGFSPDGFTLCARVIAPGEEYDGWMMCKRGHQALFYVWPSPGSDPAYTGFGFTIRPSDRFPYGYTVEPD